MEIKGEDLINEIDNLLNEKYTQDNITIFCAFYKNEDERKIIKIKDSNFIYN